MIPLFKVHMPPAVDKALLDVLHSGYIGQGERVDQFEQDFGRFVGNPNAVAVNAGTSALTLALRLAGVERGDEVITTPMTCTATNLPILSLGARPIFADIHPVSGLIRPADVEGRITPRTKAIMAVDWGGQPVDVVALMEIGRRHGLKVIVDAAHALGALHNATPDFTCFSFQAIKHITTVDGGMLLCKDAADTKRAKSLRWFGIDRTAPSKDTRIDQDIEEWGYKFHMNDVAATIGIVQLAYARDLVTRHQHNAWLYDQGLDSYFERPAYDPNASYWLFTMLLPSEAERDEFKEFMAENGVMSSQVHRRNDSYSVFKAAITVNIPSAQASYETKFPGVDNFSERMICIPVHWGLDGEQVALIVDLCNKFAARHAEGAMVAA